mmetsp:Transcript_4942/g.7469  ORF Transcript_4942/g.7469 Transcript_4942/m.7469 type:complete len:177 (-) Transcript_4942:140-670(-)
MLMGDVMVGLSAVFYSLHTLRLGYHIGVCGVSSLSLAFAKSIAELFWAVVAALFGVVVLGQGPQTLSFFRTLQLGSSTMGAPKELLVLAAIVGWNGVFVSAATMWAQTYGQARIGPSEANLVYALQPIFSAVFAMIFLKESLGGPQGVAGFAMLIGAIVLAANAQDESKDEPIKKD